MKLPRFWGKIQGKTVFAGRLHRQSLGILKLCLKEQTPARPPDYAGLSLEFNTSSLIVEDEESGAIVGIVVTTTDSHQEVKSAF